MKKLLLCMAVLSIFGCNDSSDTYNINETRCYLNSGLYLLTGDDWPDFGYVDDVFISYHELNPSIKIKWTQCTNTTKKALQNGQRVVIKFKQNNQWHIQPFELNDDIPESTIGFWITKNLQ
jgi:hypothetical protein